MYLDFNTYNFNQLKNICNAKNSIDLKKDSNATQKVKEIFDTLINQGSLDSTEFTSIQKAIYIIKPLFFLIYFDRVLISVNLKINTYVKNQLTHFESNGEWKNISADDNETVQDVIDNFTKERKNLINEILIANKDLQKKIKVQSKERQSEFQSLKNQNKHLNLCLKNELKYIHQYTDYQFRLFTDDLQKYQKIKNAEYDLIVKNLDEIAVNAIKTKISDLKTIIPVVSCKEKNEIETALNKIETKLDDKNLMLDDEYTQIMTYLNEISTSIKHLVKKEIALNQLKDNLKISFNSKENELNDLIDRSELIQKFNEQFKILLDSSINNQIEFCKLFKKNYVWLSEQETHCRKQTLELNLEQIKQEKETPKLINDLEAARLARSFITDLNQEKNELESQNGKKNNRRIKEINLELLAYLKFPPELIKLPLIEDFLKTEIKKLDDRIKNLEKNLESTNNKLEDPSKKILLSQENLKNNFKEALQNIGQFKPTTSDPLFTSFFSNEDQKKMKKIGEETIKKRMVRLKIKTKKTHDWSDDFEKFQDQALKLFNFL